MNIYFQPLFISKSNFFIKALLRTLLKRIMFVDILNYVIDVYKNL